MRISVYKKHLKRFFDLILSAIAILVLFPFFVLTTILLIVANNSLKVFFLQKRPGINGKIFSVIKFKTMTDERDSCGFLLSDEKRLTKIGKFLRSRSIDELPQLINVLKGDMALIGPRPLLVQYLPLYNKEQARRHEVRPGITGWAQIKCGNDISGTEKFKLDVWYVDHCSFHLDVKIIFLTCVRVITRTGISKEGCATTIPFDGNN